MRNVLALVTCALFTLILPFGIGTAAERMVQPKIGAEKFKRPREIKIQMESLRKKIREHLTNLLEYRQEAKDRPALLFRLAENYLEESQAWFNQAYKLTDRLAQDPRNQSLREHIESRQAVLLHKARDWKEREVGVYRQIVSEYPGFIELDRVLHYLAYALSELDRPKESLATYRILIRNHPESGYLPDAYLAFGEYYFDRGKLEKALLAYQKVAGFKSSPLFVYALFKQGWVYYNLHEYARAKQKFRQVVAVADRQEGSRGIVLRRESLKAYTLTFSREGKVNRAYQVFNELAPEEAGTMFKNLAGIYFGDGMHQKAIAAYRRLIKLERCSVEIPFYRSRILECTDRLGDPRQVVRRVRELTDSFAWTGNCLSSPTGAERLRLGEARRLVEETLRRYAVQWFKRAKRTKQKRTFEYASEFFGDYLQLFPGSPRAYDMRFAHAELLYHWLGRNQQAAVQYLKVARIEGPHRCDAAYKAVLARREILKQEPARSRKLPARRRLLLGAARAYLDYCPRDQDACAVRFEAAGLLFGLDRYDQAVGLFDRVVTGCPGGRLKVDAFLAVVDSLEKDGDLEKLEKLSRSYLENQKLSTHQKLIATIRDKLPQVSFARISRLPKTRAAPAFVGFAREFADSPLADDALHNAAVLFAAGTLLDNAARAQMLLLKRYPQSDLYPQTLFNLARTLERMARFKEATRAYERYAHRYHKARRQGRASAYHPKEAQQALINAGVYREALRQPEKSVANRLLFVKLFPRSKEAPELLNTVGLLYARLQLYRQAAAVFKRLARSYHRRSPDLAIAAHMRRAEMLIRLERRRAAEREMKITLKLFRRATRRGKKLKFAAEAAAQADFLLARSLFGHYARYQLTSSKERRIKRQFAEKMRRLDKVARRYTSIVKRQQPEWAIASLYRLGMAYENLIETLQKVGLPEKLYLQIEEKAVAHYEAAITKSSELGCYCEFTLLARKRLEKLAPRRYPQQIPFFQITTVP